MDGISLINTADGALSNMSDLLNRMRDLAVQGANGVYDGSSMGAMQDESVAIGDNQGSTESNNKGLTTAEMADPSNWNGWDTDIWNFSSYPPTFKMYTPIDAAVPDPDPTDPDNPGGNGGNGGSITPGSIRLQIGADEKNTSVIYIDTAFDLTGFDADFSSAESCAMAIDDIDRLLSVINEKRANFGAVLNRLNSILDSQVSTIENYTAAKSTIMDADIAEESANYVKNQILQQTATALLTQSQNAHAALVLSLLR